MIYIDKYIFSILKTWKILSLVIGRELDVLYMKRNNIHYGRYI